MRRPWKRVRCGSDAGWRAAIYAFRYSQSETAPRTVTLRLTPALSRSRQAEIDALERKLQWQVQSRNACRLNGLSKSHGSEDRPSHYEKAPPHSSLKYHSLSEFGRAQEDRLITAVSARSRGFVQSAGQRCVDPMHMHAGASLLSSSPKTQKLLRKLYK